jgi:hypothetical protein
MPEESNPKERRELPREPLKYSPIHKLRG